MQQKSQAGYGRAARGQAILQGTYSEYFTESGSITLGTCIRASFSSIVSCAASQRLRILLQVICSELWLLPLAKMHHLSRRYLRL